MTYKEQDPAILNILNAMRILNNIKRKKKKKKKKKNCGALSSNPLIQNISRQNTLHEEKLFI